MNAQHKPGNQIEEEAEPSGSVVQQKLITCAECLESREHAAQDLCHRCYRRRERARTEKESMLNGELTPATKRLLRSYTRVITRLADLGLSRDEILEIRDLIAHHVEPVADYLNLSPNEPIEPSPLPLKKKPKLAKASA
jgi:hypothetical protein